MSGKVTIVDYDDVPAGSDPPLVMRVEEEKKGPVEGEQLVLEMEEDDGNKE